MTDEVLPRSRQPLSILMVDSDPARARGLASALPPETAIDIVPSATMAIHALDAGEPDIVVLDVALPESGGVELIQRLHSRLSSGHALIMVVTSVSSSRIKTAALAAGAADYLVRPVTPQLFRQQIQLLSKFKELDVSWATD